MEKSKIKVGMILNITIFILELLAILWMFSGFTFSGGTVTLSAAKFAMFRYFTIDSNVIMGIIALIVACEQRKVLKGNKEELSTNTYILALVGTVGVTITMLITVFYLAPTMAAQYGLFANFKNSNFLLHLLNPIVSLVAFLGFEKTKKIKFCHTFTGIAPLLLYACYYVINVLVHIENGVILKGYDWYGFFLLGPSSVFIVLPIVILITYLISLGVWKLNRLKR